MSDAKRRAVRTIGMALAAMSAGVPTLAAVFDVPAGTVAQITGVFAFIVGVYTAVINGLEDRGTIPALLKAPASEGANPIPEGDE